MATITSPSTSSYAVAAIRRQLLDRIGRDWQPGEKLPAIRDLSTQLGAGYVSLHRAIKALSDEGILIARQRVGVFVAEDIPTDQRIDDEDDKSARPLIGLSVHMLVGRNETNRNITQLITAFEQRMRQYRCDVSRHHIREGEANWRDHSKHECDAIAILSGLVASQLTVRAGVPVVAASPAVTPTTWIEPLTDYDLVGVDNLHGGVLAGRHMREAGIDDVIVIGRWNKHPITRIQSDPPQYDNLSAMRIEGFERGFGRAIDPQRRLYAGFYGPAPAARLVPDVLAMKPRPLGVFATTDDLALGFIHGAQSHGLEPGRDFHIIGFDGQEPGRDLHDGPLTSVELLSEDMGKRAADLLAERMLHPDLPRRHFAIGCKLSQGSTVQPIHNRSAAT